MSLLLASGHTVLSLGQNIFPRPLCCSHPRRAGKNAWFSFRSWGPKLVSFSSASGGGLTLPIYKGDREIISVQGDLNPQTNLSLLVYIDW